MNNDRVYCTPEGEEIPLKFEVRLAPHMCEVGARKQIIEDLMENPLNKITPEQVNECLRNPENS